jgi:hypothetical protein
MSTRRLFVAGSTASFVLAGMPPAASSHALLGFRDSMGRAAGPNAYHRLKEPAGMLFDASGYLRVANLGRSTIIAYRNWQIVSAKRIVLPAGAAPSALALDKANRIYVTDYSNLVWVYDGKLLVETISTPDPGGVAVDDVGNVFVVNANAALLWIYDPKGQPLRQFVLPAGGWSVAIAGKTLYVGLASSVITYDVAQVLGGSATPSNFASVGIDVPTSIAFDTARNVYVANRAASARNVTKYSPSGALLQTFQASGNRCVQYEGVAVDASGNVYISNPFPLNNIMIYSPSGALVGTLT